MTMAAFTWPRWVTVGTVLVLALISAVVSYSHMYELALYHGEPEWRAVLSPLSVDGIIIGRPCRCSATPATAARVACCPGRY
ncbi:DUF2637 domain-containing protein [Nocardiopsis dassonvillei]|uniref:DUF2637 domain-containing protein n=1 Tax=Nocardiopsis dassonvillei TaxID=2014 RepID=UPI0033DC6F2E